MGKRGGRQVQIKRIKAQIKRAIVANKDWSSLYAKLCKYKSQVNSKPISWKLIPIDIEFNYPNYKTIERTDPRREIYKIRNLLGPRIIIKSFRWRRL